MVTDTPIRRTVSAAAYYGALNDPASQHREEIQSRIAVAKDLLRKDSVFNDKAPQYLSFVYRMMTNGKKYLRPEDLDVFVTPAKAMEKSRQHSPR